MHPALTASTYTAHRAYLFAVAYNLLGEVREAEDIVQDVVAHCLRHPPRDVANPKAYLARAVVNRSLDRLARRARERDAYPGPWLPEPVMTEPDEEPAPDVLSYAILCLLESLNPLERAVLVLREAFDQDYDAIAALCDIREDYCRQLLHRAKEKVRRPLKAPRTNEAQQRVFLQAFVEASFSGDAARIATLLRDDIVLYTDGGGKASAALKPLTGAATVAKFFAGLVRVPDAVGWKPALVTVNGETAVMLKEGAAVIAVFMPQLDADGRMSALYGMRNPDKIFFPAAVTN